jgi:hypothetical protein
MSEIRSQLRASGSFMGMLVSGGLIGVILCATAGTAMAGDLLRGGYSTHPGTSSNPTSFSQPSLSKARANMQDALARATLAIQAVQQMQNTARNIAARSSQNNLGINPNNPTQQLPNVPNGLGADGGGGGGAGAGEWSDGGVEPLDGRESAGADGEPRTNGGDGEPDEPGRGADVAELQRGTDDDAGL